MATSLEDLMSSPDPLADEEEPEPSTMRRSTSMRRMPNSSARSQQSLTLPRTSRTTPWSRTSMGKSPRKQTFELDVGDETKPQRILVTVEAEDEANQSRAASRRLFNSSSPTHGPARRKETATTTTIPLRGLTDDEANNPEASTVRRRGRPAGKRNSLGSKNGTPAPRGKKRAGTPMAKTTRQRPRADIGEAEVSVLSDALMVTDGNVGEPTPKPRGRPKNTPRNAYTPTASSSKSTGKKRGRPRKSLIPEGVPADNNVISEVGDHDVGNAMLNAEGETRDEIRELVEEHMDTAALKLSSFDSPTHQDTTVRDLSDQVDGQEPISRTEDSEAFETSTHEARVGDDGGFYMDDNFMGELHSHIESEQEEVRETPQSRHSRQDTLAHASDFSMINVETLPSFQASFQGNQSLMTDESHVPDDAGDETNFMINQSLEWLRQSAHGETSQMGDAENIRDESLMKDNSPLPTTRQPSSTKTNSTMPVDRRYMSAKTSSTLPVSNRVPNFIEPSPKARLRSQSRSPRRQKAIPLSRHVFANMTQVPRSDDSFSNIPESVLEAVTPGTTWMKSRANKDTSMDEDSFSEIPEEVLEAATPGHPSRGLPLEPTYDNPENEDSNMYDDSFSEIPEGVLEAATPKPPSRPTSRQSAAGAISSPSDDRNGRMTSSEPLAGGAISSPSAGRERDVNPTSRGDDSFEPNRLPTPENTSSSSIAGSKKAQHEVTQRLEESPLALNTSDLNLRSSPPAFGPQITIEAEIETAQSDQNATETPSPSVSSPHLPAPRSKSPEQSEALQPPEPNRRPTLSPILRVGRTLQSVMTDSSSPEGRESSLGSPFRGSGSLNNESRQTSVAKSPVREGQSLTQSNSYSTLSAIASFAQSIRSNFGQSQRQAPPAAIQSHVDDPLGPETQDYSQTEPQHVEACNNSHDEQAVQAGQSFMFPSVTSYTRAASPTEDEMNWMADESPAEQRTRRLSLSQQHGTTNASLFGTRGSNPTQPVGLKDTVNEDQGIDEPIEVEPADPTNEPIDNVDVDGSDEDGDAAHDPTANDGEADESGSSNAYDEEEDEEEEEEEEDIWDIEASRSLPQSTTASRTEAGNEGEVKSQLQPKAQASIANVVQSRPSKIPSPLRRSTRRLIFQDEVKSPSQIEAEDSPPSEDEEFSLIPKATTQQDSEEKATQATEPEDYYVVDRQNETVKKPQVKQAPAKSRLSIGGFDIMSFFSSPAPLPGAKPAPATVSQPTPQPKHSLDTEKPLPKEPQSALRATGLFPSIPQKAFQVSPERRMDLFFPGSALKPTDTVSHGDAESPGALPMSAGTISDTYATSPSTPEKQMFPPIEQKRNFTPLMGQSRNTAFLFTSSRQTTPVSPDDHNLDDSGPGDNSSDKDIPMAPEDGGHDSYLLSNESEYERVPPRPKPSYWDKTLSPTKSCMRSPLKPRTPGRVVEFTANLIGPAPQAESRAKHPDLGIGGWNNRTTSQVSQDPALLPAVFAGKENQRSTSPDSDTNTNSSGNTHMTNPTHIMKPTMNTHVPSTLSQKTWSKAHWIRFDELLQLRRRDQFAFQQHCPLPPKHLRKSMTILGKEVSAQGEKIILEQWHLEIVEAFRYEVGGWDERILAKRLFALIIGEERRKAGTLVKSGRRKLVAGA